MIEPFDMKYLEKYFEGFNSEITKYQWPEPFETIEDAKMLLQDFIKEMEAEERGKKHFPHDKKFHRKRTGNIPKKRAK